MIEADPNKVVNESPVRADDAGNTSDSGTDYTHPSDAWVHPIRDRRQQERRQRRTNRLRSGDNSIQRRQRDIQRDREARRNSRLAQERDQREREERSFFNFSLQLDRISARRQRAIMAAADNAARPLVWDIIDLTRDDDSE